jgi:peptidoglycan lytic transglycosylase
MRPSPRARTLACCTLALSSTGALVAASATAHSDPQDPTATAAAPTTQRERLNVRVGQTAVVTGTAPAGCTVVLQRRGARGWRALDRARADGAGRFRLRHRAARATSAQVRLRVAGAPSATRPLGRLNAYRRAAASWYGPGLYGNHLACGGRLSDSVRGVAHKTLPCGTELTLRKGDRIVRARVVDRGPFVAGREFDLTPATRRALDFGSTGIVEVSG